MLNFQKKIDNFDNSSVSQDLQRKRISWYLYDWANSAYSTSVITLFLGPFLTTLAKASSVDGTVNFLGLTIPAGSVFPYSVSISVLFQAFFLPFIGALADRKLSKNSLLAFFAVIGSICTILFFFINENLIFVGSLLLIISNVAFGSSIVIYNSYITEISNEDEREAISSKGWAIGYLGGGVLLLINLLIFLFNDFFGISRDLAVRINISMAGIWWALFSVPIISNFKKSSSNEIDKNANSNDKSTFSQFKSTVLDARNYPSAILFLLAFLFYNDGVQSIISLSSQFGQEELRLDLTFLTIVILIVQFVAALGAILFMKISLKIGEKNSILIALIVWIFILIYSFAFLSGKIDFLILAVFIAIVMGGTQAISRSLYSKLIPKSKEAEYFSFYELSEKGTSWIGPLLFGVVYQTTLSYRYAILSLIFFFVVGGVILVFTKLHKNNHHQFSSHS